MKHLITGGAGFIGSHLAGALHARGDEVLVIDDLTTGRIVNLRGLTGRNRFRHWIDGGPRWQVLRSKTTGAE